MSFPRFTRQQPFHSHLPVAGIAGIPVRRAGISLDAQVIEALVQVVDGLVLRVAPRQDRPVRQGPLSGVFEHELARPAPLAAEATLVYEAMVLAAQLHEIIQAGLTAPAPVLDVMGVDELFAGVATRVMARTLE